MSWHCNFEELFVSTALRAKSHRDINPVSTTYTTPIEELFSEGFWIQGDTHWKQKLLQISKNHLRLQKVFIRKWAIKKSWIAAEAFRLESPTMRSWRKTNNSHQKSFFGRKMGHSYRNYTSAQDSTTHQTLSSTFRRLLDLHNEVTLHAQPLQQPTDEKFTSRPL